MPPTSRPKPGVTLDSPHADQALRDFLPRRFPPEMEAEYQRNRLANIRTLLRATSLLAVLVMLLRGLDQAVFGPPNLIFLIAFGVLTVLSALVSLVAWSPLYERLYPLGAAIVVPVRSAIVVAQMVNAAAHGQLEVLMGLPVMLAGAFFFFGLRIPAALLSGTLMVLSFAVSAVCFHLGLAVAIRAGAFLVAAVIACSMAARHLETWSRAAFIEAQRIADFAQHDALTGTKNRRVFDEHLVRLWQQAIEDERAIAIVLIDVDHFKAYNDCYGHLAGDQTLRRIAQTAQRFIRRPLDILARYGGEEFAVILYDMDAAQAKDLANRICRAVSALTIEHHESATAPVVTISAGIAALRPTIERNPKGAVQLADQALYEAKLRGRNRIHALEDGDHKAMVTGVFAVPFLEANG